jgi:FkbM family methyltransferase
LQPAQRKTLVELRDFARVLRDIKGATTRGRVMIRLVGSRIAQPNGRLAERLGGEIRIPFRSFEAEFELSQGEISPYVQMLNDLETGVIPTGPRIDQWTVVDCGANVGLFSLFLRAAARTIAIEPNPSANRRLKRNFDLNGLEGAVIQAAVSDHDGSVRMDFGSAPSVLATVGSNGSDVPCLSLDTIFAQQKISTVDLLKLDVEGHEIEALDGCSDALKRRAIKRIVAEYTDDDTLEALTRYLARYDFRDTATGEINARFELEPEPEAH